MRDMQEYTHEYAEYYYYKPSELERLGGVWPVRAGRNIAKPNYQVGSRFIECYSIHFVREGQVKLERGEESVILRQGDLFCLFPQIAYSYQVVPSSSPLQMCWLAIDGGQVPSLLQAAGVVRERPYREQAVGSHVNATLDALMDTLRELRGTSSSLAILAFIYQLFSQLAVRQANSPPVKRSAWVQQSVDFMNLHFAEGITIQDAANYAGVHRSHFSTVFTEQMGVPPLRYLQKLKMDKAARLLQDTSLPITEIALSTGYPDLFSFSKAFAKYFGQPPSHYRK
ncbi:AraC family transcriptional regulator [Paenibacillus sp. J2TS4]|uniref:AraC family transcriptional regulator n=1 Tax=Paenibacillus sp. J2TS4 TaxID=2807194 RepID=UPI001B2A4744|nr:AraC family transcriptional regulator [Paenibacillus sp. J2TS4]GIP33244.1 AraC family transcriptional regulator [Paenibacillus sp. J2TS4]